LLVPAFRLDRRILKSGEYMLRPPGAASERDFLQKCVRCGECMRVCVTNALQPAFLEAGMEGIWTPLLVPRIGYCEYNCNLCGSVCPSEALKHLPINEKKLWRMGTAYFNKNRCLPWNDLVNCSVCEEACPVSPKSIELKETNVRNDEGKLEKIKQPYMVEERCIGCGMCEFSCPVEGESAIRVTRKDESRSAPSI
jgi:MauM/NapG family ferredoxin protein